MLGILTANDQHFKIDSYKASNKTYLHIREIIAEGSAAPRFHFSIITMQT